MCYILGRGKTKAFILLLQSFSKSMFLAGLEPATFRVWGGRDNHQTTETPTIQLDDFYITTTDSNEYLAVGRYWINDRKKISFSFYHFRKML